VDPNVGGCHDVGRVPRTSGEAGRRSEPAPGVEPIGTTAARGGEQQPIEELTVLTTYRCNSKCVNCSIWRDPDQLPSGRKLEASEIRTVLHDPLLRRAKVCLAGGEPTLADSLSWFLAGLPKGANAIVITNGLRPTQIIDVIRSLKGPHPSVVLSIDGIGATHDRMRGVPGAFEKAHMLLTTLPDFGITTGVSFTINRLNFRDVVACYELAREHGAEFRARIAHTGGVYRNEANRAHYTLSQKELCELQEMLYEIVEREVVRKEHDPAWLVYLWTLSDYHNGKLQRLPCAALSSTAAVDLYGRVMINCPEFLEPIGDLREASFSDIWRSEQAERTRAEIERRCAGCWIDCQAMANLRGDDVFVRQRYRDLKVSFLTDADFSDPIDLGYEPCRSLLDGWFASEGGTHRWTEQEFAVAIPGGTRGVTMLCAVPPFARLDRPVLLEAEVEGRPVESIEVRGTEWQEISLWFPIPTKDTAVCRFRLDRAFCPRVEGAGPDERRLGMAVSRITYERT